MDINKCSKEIFKKNLHSDKKVMNVSDNKIKAIIRNHIRKINGTTIILGYRRDVDRFKRCTPSSFGNITFKYIELKDWTDHLHNELIQKIAGYPCDRMIIVSEDLRQLLAMNLISEGVSYEILDIYEMLKMDYSIELRMNIGSTAVDILKLRTKEFIKRGGVFLAEKIPPFRKIQSIGYWRTTTGEICDHYDGIFVKKYYYQSARECDEKKYYLGELIIDYLKIKDFINAFYYIDEFIRLFGEEGNHFLQIKNQFVELLSQIKEQLSMRKEKDIVVFWCDSLQYSDFREWDFLGSLQEDSMFFENAYTHVPYTHPTFQAMFTGVPYFESGLAPDLIVDKMVLHGKTIELLEKNHYKICMPWSWYLHIKYHNRLAYLPKRDDNGAVPGTMIMWETLNQLLQGDEKKFIVCHMLSEVHTPFWNGESQQMRTADGNLTKGIEPFMEQRKESASYLEKQILYYFDFLGENTCEIFMSDHGVPYGAAWLERRLHAFCFVKDKDVMKGKYSDYFSYLNFGELINYILFPTADNLNKVFSKYVLIQNDYPYSKQYCNIIINKVQNDRNFAWKDLMGFRGIIKNGYKLICFADGTERWFDLEDKEIDIEKLRNRTELVDFMRENVGNIFPDIYKDDRYRYTRELYAKLKKFS